MMACCVAGALLAVPAQAHETIFVSTDDYAFNNPGDWWVQGFTLHATTKFRFRFASDYNAQAAVIPVSSLSSFENNGAFSGYGNFSGNFGTKGLTLGAGSYYVAMRSETNGANTASIELDFDTVPSGYRFAGKVMNGAKTVPAGGKLWQGFRLKSPASYTYYLDGCNSGGLNTYIIPASQLGNFLSGGTFRYYSSYSSSTGEAPGQWEVRLRAGKYFLVFANTTAIPKSVTYEMLGYKRLGR